jgi:hypothetical protein
MPGVPTDFTAVASHEKIARAVSRDVLRFPCKAVLPWPRGAAPPLREKRESVVAASEAGLENRSLDRAHWRIHWRTDPDSRSSKP